MGSDTSILSRAELLTEHVNSWGEYSVYVSALFHHFVTLACHLTLTDSPASLSLLQFIPSKMLYDPCPAGNDPGDPTCDMTPWMEYSNGALNFNYRRRLGEVESNGDNASSALLDRERSTYESVRYAAHAAQLKHSASKVRRGAAQRRRAGVLGGGALDRGDELLLDDDFSVDNASRASARRGRALQRRQLLSAKIGDWRDRMVFFPGDERETFYAGQTGRMCPPDAAIMDPACRVSRRTHREVAYNSYGTFTKDCILDTAWNAWVCKKEALVPARLIIENMDSDFAFDVMDGDASHQANHKRMRFITPATLATGGYVDFLNGGWWVHGGFSTTVAINRTYDFAMASTNPRQLRFALPNGIGHHYDYGRRWDLTGKWMPADTDFHRKAQEARIIMSVFYSNPEKLEVRHRLPLSGEHRHPPALPAGIVCVLKQLVNASPLVCSPCPLFPSIGSDGKA